MPPPNTPEEGVTAPTSPALSANTLRAPSSPPSSAVAHASRAESSLGELDFQSLEYVDPVDETLLCPVCRTPFHSPITTPCGHTFCAACINRALEMQPTCPIDRQPINKTRDYRKLPLIVKEQLDRLRVKCPNTGCDYECSREHIERHYERRCEFTPVPCPDVSCFKFVARRDALPGNKCMHRDVTCQYCNKTVTVAELDVHYDHSCDGATAQCSQCNTDVVRHRLARHKAQDCPEGQTKCKWHTAGCKVAGKRQIVREHEQQQGCTFEAIGRLLDERAQDRKCIDDLCERLTAIETARHSRRDHRSRRERVHARQMVAPPGCLDANVVPDLSLNNNRNDGQALYPAATIPQDVLDREPNNNNLGWDSPEDYMLAQFERMEGTMEDLRKQMIELDGRQSLTLLQTAARLNEQLTELGSKVGVLNMHTTWLMNMQRQSHHAAAQQRAATSTTAAGGSSTGTSSAGAMAPPPHSPGGSGGGLSRSSSEAGSSSDTGGRYQPGGRRISSENPPRL